MMEEELRQEAEGYFETSCPYSYADTEDDLKHDVTEAYMAGAEPREKRIKELEEINAELKNAIYKHEYYQNGYTQGKLDESRRREVEVFEIHGQVELRGVRIYDLNKKVTKLEKENAELRTKTTALENANRAMIKELDEMTSGGVSVLENVVRSKEQLAKAKEIIEELYNIIPASISDYAKEPMEYARKFLTDEAAKKFRVTKKKIL